MGMDPVKLKVARCVRGLVVALALVATVAPRVMAQADESASAVQASAARVPTHEYRTGPDFSLLRTGLWTLSVAYASSVVVAATSPRDADNYLFVPIAGPWLDLSHRDSADNGKYETFYKTLLIADGLIQGFAAAQIAWSFIVGETRLVSLNGSTQHTGLRGFAMRTTPMFSRDVFGLRTVGEF